LELTWTPLPWSTRLEWERVRLMGRLLRSSCECTQNFVEVGTTREGSWTSLTLSRVHAWSPNGVPRSPGEWRKVIGRWSTDAAVQAKDAAWRECQGHPRLRHYNPAVLKAVGKGPNHTIYDKAIRPEEARIVGRILCGGQGLRAGDAAARTTPTCHNCCIACLREGRIVADTLTHFVGDCRATAAGRDTASMRTVIGRTVRDLCCHSRSTWTWSELRTIRRYLSNGWNAKVVLSRPPRGFKKRLMEWIDEVWSEHAAVVS
jgi:hypothetical protein